jgi:hypothetical protein
MTNQCMKLIYLGAWRAKRVDFGQVLLHSLPWYRAVFAAPRAAKAWLLTSLPEIIHSMRQPRVRRPFIVESRGSGRDGLSVAIPKRIPSSPQTARKVAAEAARPLFDPWAAVTTPPEPTAQRRILPNIMAPPEPAPVEPEAAAPAEEAPLPRVRRVKPRAAPAPRTRAPVEAAPAPEPLPVPVEASKPEAPKSDAAKSDAALAPLVRMALREGRTGRAALPAGQRWKARLPRACW